MQIFLLPKMVWSGKDAVCVGSSKRKSISHDSIGHVVDDDDDDEPTHHEAISGT